MSFENAAALGVELTAVGQGLFQELGLPLPPARLTEPTPILIYGGSTVTGTLAIQFAKLVGCEVIVTAPGARVENLKKLGADQVFDISDPTCGSKICGFTKDRLKLVYDCVAEKRSSDICAAAISSTGGHLVSLLPLKEFPRKDVKAAFRLFYTALGRYYNDDFPASSQDFVFGSKFWKLAESLLADEKIVSPRIEVRRSRRDPVDGRFENILDTLQELKRRNYSVFKLVCTLEYPREF